MALTDAFNTAMEEPPYPAYLKGGEWHEIRNWADVRTAIREGRAISIGGVE